MSETAEPSEPVRTDRSARRLARQASISVTGERLTRLMNDRGLSTVTLAAAIGIQSNTLENFRRGYRGLPDDVLQSLARQLNTNANFLLDRSDDPRPPEEPTE